MVGLIQPLRSAWKIADLPHPLTVPVLRCGLLRTWCFEERLFWRALPIMLWHVVPPGLRALGEYSSTSCPTRVWSESHPLCSSCEYARAASLLLDTLGCGDHRGFRGRADLIRFSRELNLRQQTMAQRDQWAGSCQEALCSEGYTIWGHLLGCLRNPRQLCEAVPSSPWDLRKSIWVPSSWINCIPMVFTTEDN